MDAPPTAGKRGAWPTAIAGRGHFQVGAQFLIQLPVDLLFLNNDRSPLAMFRSRDTALHSYLKAIMGSTRDARRVGT
jgi:hypothetical protein